MEINRISSTPQLAGSDSQNDMPAEDRELLRAVKRADRAKAFGADNEIVFAVDEATNRPVVRLVESHSKTVVRQIPAEEVLEVARELDRWIRSTARRSGR